MDCASAACRVLGSLPRVRRRQSLQHLRDFLVTRTCGCCQNWRTLSLKRSQLINWLFPSVSLDICHSGSLGPALCPSVIGCLPSGAQREVLSRWGESQSLTKRVGRGVWGEERLSPKQGGCEGRCECPLLQMGLLKLHNIESRMGEA